MAKTRFLLTAWGVNGSMSHRRRARLDNECRARAIGANSFMTGPSRRRYMSPVRVWGRLTESLRRTTGP